MPIELGGPYYCIDCPESFDTIIKLLEHYRKSNHGPFMKTQREEQRRRNMLPPRNRSCILANGATTPAERGGAMQEESNHWRNRNPLSEDPDSKSSQNQIESRRTQIEKSPIERFATKRREWETWSHQRVARITNQQKRFHQWRNASLGENQMLPKSRHRQVASCSPIRKDGH